MLKEESKSQSMPMNIIIIAVILLVVLVIILSIFTGNIGKFSKDLQSCGARNGQCEPGTCGEGKIKIEGVSCPKNNNNGQVCCVKVLE